jgi:tRNA modification GTPase
MTRDDTIAAIATPAGRGGIGIVRASGPRVPAIAEAVLGRIPEPRHALFGTFTDARGELIDRGIALYFDAPRSFTGEHVLELHAHGGPVVLTMLLRRVLELGARAAEAGEFSLRAYLNDKLDLAQAEALADLIDAGSAQAARAAVRALEGELSQQAAALAEGITDLRVRVEAAIDFPEEEVDFLADPDIAARLAELLGRCDELLSAAGQGRLLRDGMNVVIAGRPNAGKSSLLNRLAGYEAAIVTEIPGTTRDLLRERVHIEGMPVHVIDTAGLRESGDAIELEGVRRALAEMARADRVLLVLDANTGEFEPASELSARLPSGVPVTVVHNKIDLTGEKPSIHAASVPPRVRISARTGAGIDLLRSHLMECMGYAGADAGAISARARHLDALRRTRASLEAATHQLEGSRAGELVAEELRTAHRALAEISGEVTSEELLGRIFATFCIGK